MLSNGYNDTTLKMNFTVGVLELLLYIHNVLSMYSTLKIIMGPRATWVWILPTGRRRSVRCLVKSGEKCYPGHMCQHLYTTIHSSSHRHPSFLPMRKQLYFQTPIVTQKIYDGMNQNRTFSGISLFSVQYYYKYMFSLSIALNTLHIISKTDLRSRRHHRREASQSFWRET